MWWREQEERQAEELLWRKEAEAKRAKAERRLEEVLEEKRRVDEERKKRERKREEEAALYVDELARKYVVCVFHPAYSLLARCDFLCPSLMVSFQDTLIPLFLFRDSKRVSGWPSRYVGWYSPLARIRRQSSIFQNWIIFFGYFDPRNLFLCNKNQWFFGWPKRLEKLHCSPLMLFSKLNEMCVGILWSDICVFCIVHINNVQGELTNVWVCLMLALWSSWYTAWILLTAKLCCKPRCCFQNRKIKHVSDHLIRKLFLFIVGMYNFRGGCTNVSAETRTKVAVFWPKYWLGHPENYLISLSKKSIFWIKVSKHIFYLILKTEPLELAGGGDCPAHRGVYRSQVHADPALWGCAAVAGR